MSSPPPDPMPSSPRPPVTAVAPARDLVVAQLSEAFANDALSLDELERRIASAYAATSPAELVALTSDLPPKAVALAPPQPSAVGTVMYAPQRLSAVFGNIERGGVMDVPAYLELRVFCGNMELDLSHARFAPGLTEISVRSVMGNVELTLPSGVQVENFGESFLSSMEYDVGGSADVPDAASIVRITGRHILSSIEVSKDS